MINMKFKQSLHEQVVKLVQKQITELTQAIDKQQEGAQGSSSAGDKHNTEGAMQHLELEKKHIQLATALQNQENLNKIKLTSPNKRVSAGAMVRTNRGLFFFSIALGKIKCSSKDVMVLSLASPIGQVLKNMKIGEEINFNDSRWCIEEII